MEEATAVGAIVAALAAAVPQAARAAHGRSRKHDTCNVGNSPPACDCTTLNMSHKWYHMDTHSCTALGARLEVDHAAAKAVVVVSVAWAARLVVVVVAMAVEAPAVKVARDKSRTPGICTACSSRRDYSGTSSNTARM